MRRRDKPRKCIFCFEPATSGEHLLPEWLQRLLPSKEPVIHMRGIEGDPPKSWTKRGAFKEKTMQVCKKCNHGWMCRLESATKPILAPAIAREARCEFDLRDQWIAALWAVKTSYVFQSQGPNLLAPRIRPFLVRENGMPSPQTSVFLGSHARAVRDPINSCYILKPLALVPEPRQPSHQTSNRACYILKPLALVPEDDHLEPTRPWGYLAFLAVAGISFVIIEHSFTNYVEITFGQQGEHPVRQLFTKIWPRSSKVVSWPPLLQMDRELVEPFLLMDQPPAFDIRVFPGSRHHTPPFSEAF